MHANMGLAAVTSLELLIKRRNKNIQSDCALNIFLECTNVKSLF